MSKRVSTAHQSTEEKYNLDNYKRTEFFKRIVKEITKHDKKLQKIENHEKLKAEGKPLSKEVQELISKKQDFVWQVKSLIRALDLYQEGIAIEEKSIRDGIITKFKKDYEERLVRRLGYFFAAGRVLTETRRVVPRPLGRMWGERQTAVGELYRALTVLPRGVLTSLAQEARKSSNALNKLLKGPYFFLEELADDTETIEAKFLVKNPKEEKYLYDIKQSAAPSIKKQKEEPVAKSKFSNFFDLESEDSEEIKHGSGEKVSEASSDEAEQKEPEDVIYASNKSEEEEEFEIVISKSEARKRAKEEKSKELQAEIGSRGNIREEEDEDTNEEDYMGYNTEEEYTRQRKRDETSHPKRGGDFRRGKGGYGADGGRGRYSRADRRI